jgi:hypothetical protein
LWKPWKNSQTIFPPFPQRLRLTYHQELNSVHSGSCALFIFLGTMENSPSKTLRVSHSPKIYQPLPMSPNTLTYLSEPYIGGEGVSAFHILSSAEILSITVGCE